MLTFLLLQGLGGGPCGILAGTGGGSIYLWDSLTQLEPLQLGRPLDDPPYYDRAVTTKEVSNLIFNVPVTCLAATDEVVVNGFCSGAMRVMRLHGPLASECILPASLPPRLDVAPQNVQQFMGGDDLQSSFLDPLSSSPVVYIPDLIGGSREMS